MAEKLKVLILNGSPRTGQHDDRDPRDGTCF